jgi:diaminohydroxyphosphoribosylaminopyrimidine deaminase / 5-amino-6-(5-phosphoribosylamino)uracil reductase
VTARKARSPIVAHPRSKPKVGARSGARRKTVAKKRSSSRPSLRPSPIDPVERSREESLMRVALELASRAAGRTTPNPAVGAVIVKDGRIIAGGFTAPAGGDHAEVAALRKLDFSAVGCELYTTLEPCDHFGRTGPCTEAILRSGIRRVVVGAVDPNPIVAGRGIRKLLCSGVEVVQGVLEDECQRSNEVFNFAIIERRPFVVLKAAASLDGRIATKTRASKWITSEESRREVHLLRDRLDAILVGINTVENDDPSLTARVPGGRDPVRVVLDSRLRIAPGAGLVRTAKETRTIVLTTPRAPARKRKQLERLGVDVIGVKADKQGRVDLDRALEAIYGRELNSVLVEGGATVHGAFIDRRLANKLVFFIAPLVIGGAGAVPSIGGDGAKIVGDALALDIESVRPVGPDLMVTAYPRSHA